MSLAGVVELRPFIMAKQESIGEREKGKGEF